MSAVQGNRSAIVAGTEGPTMTEGDFPFRNFTIRGDGYDQDEVDAYVEELQSEVCLLYTSPSPRDATLSRMPSSA